MIVETIGKLWDYGNLAESGQCFRETLVAKFETSAGARK